MSLFKKASLFFDVSVSNSDPKILQDRIESYSYILVLKAHFDRGQDPSNNLLLPLLLMKLGAITASMEGDQDDPWSTGISFKKQSNDLAEKFSAALRACSRLEAVITKESGKITLRVLFFKKNSKVSYEACFNS